MVEQSKKEVTGKSKLSKKKDDNGRKKITFRFYNPEASEVFIAGDFNAWDTRSLPMKKGKDGTWKSQITLSPGQYEYKLFADNCWVEGIACLVEVNSECTPDVSGSEMVYNSSGTKNCVFLVS